MPSQLPDTLVTTLSAHLGLSKSRLETLARLIVLLVNVRSSNLSHIAAQFSSTAKIASSYRRLQRFFQFVRLDEDWLAKAVIKLLKINPPWILCLDRTQWQIGNSTVNVLVLAVVTRRCRLPLMWTLLDKKGCSSGAERIDLMRRYLKIFGSGSIRYLLADREFIGPDWFEFLLEHKVIFAIRAKGQMLVRFDNGRVCLIKNLAPTRAMKAFLREHKARFSTMPARLGTPLRLVCKKLANGELLVVATNAHNPAEALRTYKKRWFIECLFGDSKTRGLNMEDTRLTDLGKLALLIAVITLAMVWSQACATAALGRRNINKAKHGYLRKSWFRTGFDHLRMWIIHHPDKAAQVWLKLWPKTKITFKTIRVV